MLQALNTRNTLLFSFNPAVTSLLWIISTWFTLLPVRLCEMRPAPRLNAGLDLDSWLYLMVAKLEGPHAV